MKAFSRLAAIAVAKAVLMFTTTAAAQTAQTPVQQQAPVQQREIIVSLEDHKLALVENGEVIKIYSVAVGKPSTPSPEGTFTIARRVKNPTYHHDGKTVLPGPGNPVGTRWMGLSKTGYGIHGTNEPKSIGKSASHGCIRMAKADLEEFYELVSVGDTVRLIGHADEETARLFAPDDVTAPAVQPTQTASTEAAPAAPAATDPAPATPVASLGTR
jgi:lipoprotein-anchoring transpeptidase ErfK/SrfK